MSKQKTAVRSAAAGSPSDFFRQRPRFFAFYTFFPAVGTVKVSDGFIDRLTNCETGKFQALKVQGGIAPFFRSVSAGLPGRFLRRFFAFPPLSHSLPLNYLLGWKRRLFSPVNSVKTSRNLNFQQSSGKDVKNHEHRNRPRILRYQDTAFFFSSRYRCLQPWTLHPAKHAGIRRPQCLDETKEQVRQDVGVSVTDAQVERVLAGKPCSILQYRF